MSTIGLLLAAGAGQRYGGPKALVPGWIEHAVTTLIDGGCDEVRVVLGAEATRARALVPPDVEVTVVDDWAEGMASSLRGGLQAVADSTATAALVHLVDLPDVGADVVRRVLAAGAGQDSVLVRATYDTSPGHPVLIGRAHWHGLIDTATGDTGARAYLRDHPHVSVECGDLATGTDVDRPANP
jgi:CTP:molybdopterin cytidylyltransferase MocA